MKNLLLLAMAIIGIAMSSCKKENNEIFNSETEGLLKIMEMSDAEYTVELYSATGNFQLGYNEVYLRLKEKATGNYQSTVNFSWAPIMNMMTSTHSCPKSTISKPEGKQTLYNGYVVFQMPENNDEHWTLTINYETAESTGSVSNQISVPSSIYKKVSVFTGADSKKYIIALVQPQKPTVAINDLTLGLFSMESMMSFPQVANYQISFDPRMPDMGNHSSPNNENPVFSDADGMYHGKLSLTMTGRWKLNLIVRNQDGNILKGEDVTNTQDSSLYLELEAN